MRRREFVTSLGVLVLETAAVYAAAPTTLGGRLRRLTAPGTGDNRATYLPDGTALLFASRRTGRSQIWTMDPDGGDPRRLYESAANDYGRVAPSPDGTRLSFSSDRSGQNVVLCPGHAPRNDHADFRPDGLEFWPELVVARPDSLFFAPRRQPPQYLDGFAGRLGSAASHQPAW